ncbi:MAG: TIGR03619 family F420-dependent LLM class oxidoreductase [Acidimicrobiia bacterium]|nr:TIGR03619 family F420-dependent LLM class oxidoreductase [Acidimicrobiia bacterium]
MRWTVAFPMFPADHLVPMARAAEEAGFDSITVPDSVFFPEAVSADYPYSPDGGRFWTPETPFVDPFVAISAMTAVTERIRFLTNVIKLPIRDPLLVAKQLSSMAVLSKNRIGLGVGLSWIPEEFAWTHTEMKTRGKRADEMIQILKLVCAGNGPEWVEYHGNHYDFDRLMMSPAPDQPVPIYVGGLSEPGFRRAARLADGWISVQNTTAEIVGAIEAINLYRAEYGRADQPFEINALPTDAFELDGYHRLADAGVTELQTVPWYFFGGDPNDLGVQLDSLTKFADTIITKF